jgi:hypothetical protein
MREDFEHRLAPFLVKPLPFAITDEELELIIGEMKTIRDTRAYAKHEAAGAAF